MAEPAVRARTLRQRAAVLRADARLAVGLAAVFATAIDGIVDEIERLVRRLDGGDLSPDDPAVATLLAEIESAIAGLVPIVVRAIVAARREATAVASLHAGQQVADDDDAPPVPLVGRAERGQVVGIDPRGPLALALLALGAQAVVAVRASLTAPASRETGTARAGVVGANVRTALAQVVGGVDGAGVPRLGWLEMVSRSTLMDAYRDGLTGGYANANDPAESWRWVASLDGSTCSSCVAKHGQVFPVTVNMESHRGCRCVAEPVRPGENAETGADWLRRQPEATQRTVLGIDGAERWRAGAFDLWHLLEDRDDPLFGPYKGHGSIGRAVARARSERERAA